METLSVSLVWLFAAFINGVTSFGGNLVAVPVLSLMMEPREAVLISCASGISINLLMSWMYQQIPPMKETMLLLFSAVCGTPIGLIVLRNAHPRFFLLLTGILLLFFLAWQLVSAFVRRSSTSIGEMFSLPFGFVFGILFVITGVPGPVLAIYGILRRWPKDTMLFMMNFIGTAGAFIAVSGHASAGLLNGSHLASVLTTIPFCIAGVMLSLPVVKRTKVQLFRLLVLVMISISAFVLIFRGLHS